MSDRQLSAPALVPAIALFAACFVARDSSPSASPRSPGSPPPGPTPRLDGAAALDRDALICAVLAQNADLAAAEHAIEAARAGALRPVAADTTRVDLAIAPASLGRNVSVGYLIEVGQSFRLGQRKLERRIASSDARSASHRRDEVRNELARTAATLFDDHFEFGRALETNAEHRSRWRTCGLARPRPRSLRSSSMHSNPFLVLGLSLAFAAGCPSPSLQSVGLVAPQPDTVRRHSDPAALDRADVLDRAALVCAVLDQNPDVAAAEDALAAARAAADRPTAAGATRVAFSIAPASLGRNVPFGYVVELEQSVRLGQRRLERDLATSEAEVFVHRRDQVRNELALAAASIYDDHFELARALETNAAHVTLLTELVETAKRRYAAGLVSAQDPLQAELELARLEQERVEIETQRTITTARANRLLHREPGTPLPPAPDRLVRADDAANKAGLQGEALASRPELRAANVDAEARARSVALARKRFAPELTAMASYNSMWADVEHRFMMGVGLMLPLQLRALRAGVTEARAQSHRATRMAAAERDRVAEEVEVAVARVSAAEGIVQLHADRLLPIARERVEAAMIGYESNANDIDALIDAERELRSIELDAQRALAELDRRKAALDWAVGRAPCVDAGVRR